MNMRVDKLAANQNLGCMVISDTDIGTLTFSSIEQKRWISESSNLEAVDTEINEYLQNNSLYILNMLNQPIGEKILTTMVFRRIIKKEEKQKSIDPKMFAELTTSGTIGG